MEIYIHEMKNKETYNKWIDVAYKEFADYGPEFSLKALSNKANLPRATFYYHFDTKENLIDELIKHHFKIVDLYCVDLQQNVKQLIPDLYQVMFKYLTSVKFHKHLLVNFHNENYKSIYYQVNLHCIELLLPLIRDLFGSHYTNNELIKFYNVLTDAWYTRLDVNKISVKSMCELAIDIMTNTLGLYTGQNKQLR